MSLIKHAEVEMALAWPEADDMQDLVKDNIRELLAVFAAQGHSGFSAPYVLAAFTKLARFEPLTPLTGEDHEWVEVGDSLFQNARCGEVFREGKNGEAYWINGRVFREPDGCTFTSRDSRVPVVFPWTKPAPEIVDVAEAAGE